MDSSIFLSSIDLVIVRLRILASISPGDKICVGPGGEDVSIDPPSAMRCFRRALKGDGRAGSLEAIHRIVMTTRRTWRALSTDRADARHLRDAAVGAVSGLKTLRQTYAADPTTTARLDAICDRLEDLIND